MSKFHEILKELLEEMHTFLSSTLAKEMLSSDGLSKKESLLMKISVLKREYPQLQVKNSMEYTAKEIRPIPIDIITSNNPTCTAPASPPPYFDMETKKHSPILSSKSSNQTIPVNSEEYEEYDGDCSEFAVHISQSEIKNKNEMDSSNVDEACKDIPDVPASELKKTEKYGFLEKKGKERLGGLLSPFQKRWCSIKSGIMYIYETENDKKQKGYIDLFGYEVRANPMVCKDLNKKNLCFELVCPGKRTYQFIALTTKDLKQWTSAIDKNNALGSSNTTIENFPSITSTPKLTESPSKGKLNPSKELPETPPIREIPPHRETEDIYEPVDELESPISEPLYEEGELLSSTPVEEELYVDGSDQPPTEKEDPMFQPNFNPSDWYVALWDCDSADAMELKFLRGDLIKIISKQFDANAWWTGILNNKTGLVPKSFLMEAYEIVTH